MRLNEAIITIKPFHMKSILSQEALEILKTISKDRSRTNLFKTFEQKTLVFLVQRIPSWINSDMLTFIGFIGSLIVLSGFILASYIHRNYLFLGLLGFVINWIGDSLDGRLAYFRNQPRKWYGFSLDLTVDWITTILIGCGYMIYTDGNWKMLGFGFVVMYGWAMITTLLRYKVTGKYIIDSGWLGPTEARIIISAIMVAEVFFKNSILYSAIFVCVLLFIVDISETVKLLRLANDLDIAEKERTMKEHND
jgi:phosphatidylglycerophosphate synthase